ncbi:hypothetical protein [Mitsuaria sp. GD03876]|uniref:hypothetical protein n=1 Tax=Mitsuaria sp. GD03876 TaxID=2975399 RepID=UPI00244B8A26|nr:hypothetical protein [Mitsuaria sp. GD03876]MDH0864914.1 hypothetical protein [Mitsuaria sp. GD03876]
MKKLFAALTAVAAALPVLSTAAHAAGLTPLEQRWVAGMTPVLVHAKGTGMPVDIVVQPQDAPEAAPLALGFKDGRCKLVLSLRGNPEGEATLGRVPEGLEDAALELMAAHELGHCRRYLDGAWFQLPAGFTAGQVPDGLSPDLQRAYQSMKSTRREEGYGDLVALSWTAQRHPAQYAALHAWLTAERGRDLLPGSHHDTLAWLKLARDPKALGSAGSMFEAATATWQSGLNLDDD